MTVSPGSAVSGDDGPKQGLLTALDPADRLCEVTCGLVMTLTILLTAGYYVEDADDPAHTLLVVAVGCNLAWGLIDGLLYVMSDMYDRAKQRRGLDALRSADPARGQAFVRERLTRAAGAVLTTDEETTVASALYAAATRTPDPPSGITIGNVRTALVTVLLNMLALVPPVLVFALVDDWSTALDLASALLVTMMFLVGEGWGREVGLRPWRAGASMVLIGGTMVAIAVVLGG